MRFLGSPYPIMKDARGFFNTQHGINQIKSDLLILLLTNPGERCMLPTFGTPLRQLVFEPNDATLARKAKQMIIHSIALWEPRIVIQQIQVTNGIDANELIKDPNQNPKEYEDTQYQQAHILNIKIKFYDPENIKAVQELVLEVPLASGA